MQTPTAPEPGAKLAAAATGIILALAEAIRSLGSVPAGTLYAHVMGKLSLEEFDRIVLTLCNAGVVERTPAHVLNWKGPALK